MCTSTTTETNTSKAKAATTTATTKHKGNVDTPPVYTLRDHCRYLHLKTETTDTATYWYCDFTHHFVQPNAYAYASHKNKNLPLLQDVVQEYCQPLGADELTNLVVGISSSSSSSSSNNNHSRMNDPIPVRTISIQLRPETKQATVWEAVEEAFDRLHPHHACQFPTSNDDGDDSTTTSSASFSFQAIGADGAVPLWMTALVATHRKTLQRRLWLRFYHASQKYLDEEQLQLVGGVSNQKAPLRNVHTPLNTQLAEARRLRLCDLCDSGLCRNPTLFRQYMSVRHQKS
jgi:hypothetical protein